MLWAPVQAKGESEESRRCGAVRHGCVHRCGIRGLCCGPCRCMLGHTVPESGVSCLHAWQNVNTLPWWSWLY